MNTKLPAIGPSLSPALSAREEKEGTSSFGASGWLRKLPKQSKAHKPHFPTSAVSAQEKDSPRAAHSEELFWSVAKDDAEEMDKIASPPCMSGYRGAASSSANTSAPQGFRRLQAREEGGCVDLDKEVAAIVPPVVASNAGSTAVGSTITTKSHQRLPPSPTCRTKRHRAVEGTNSSPRGIQTWPLSEALRVCDEEQPLSCDVDVDLELARQLQLEEDRARPVPSPQCPNGVAVAVSPRSMSATLLVDLEDGAEATGAAAFVNASAASSSTAPGLRLPRTGRDRRKPFEADLQIALQLQQEEARGAAAEALSDEAVVDLEPPSRRRRMHEGESSRATLRRQLQQTDGDFTSEDYELLLRLDEAPTRGAAAKEQRILQKGFLSRLPVRKVAKGEELEKCSICLEEMLPKSDVRTLPCMHHFHRKCIDKWLLTPGVVPRCPVDQVEIASGLS